MENNVLLAFLLTLLAGLSTGIGSALAFFTRRSNVGLLSAALGFSAGVMIYVSFNEILSKARQALTGAIGDVNGAWATAIAFFSGILFITLIDRFIPSFENPHEPHPIEDMDDARRSADFKSLHRMGILSAVAIAIHNFPEGLATFTAALKDPGLGIAIAIAIAIHNIPEGIAVAVPIYYATENRGKAFTFSFLSGMSEPLGALIGYLVLRPFFNDIVFGVLFAFVAGIMVFISLDELLPAARRYAEGHTAVYGLISGMAVMAVSLLLFL